MFFNLNKVNLMLVVYFAGVVQLEVIVLLQDSMETIYNAVVILNLTHPAYMNICSQSEQFEMMRAEQLPVTTKSQTPVSITVYEASSSSPQLLKPIGTLIPAEPLTPDANPNRNKETHAMSMQSSCSIPQFSNINTPSKEFQKYTQSDRTTATPKPNYACAHLPAANTVHNSLSPNVNLLRNYQPPNLKSHSGGNSCGVGNPNMATRTPDQQGIFQNRSSREIVPKPLHFGFSPSVSWTSLPTSADLQSSANLINVPSQRMQVQTPPGHQPSCNLVLAPLDIKPNSCSGIFAFVNSEGYEKQNSAMSSYSSPSKGNTIEKYVRPSIYSHDSYCGAPNRISGLDSKLNSPQFQTPFLIQNSKSYNPSFVGSNQNVQTYSDSVGYPAYQAYNKPINSCSPNIGCVPYNYRYNY